MIDKVAVAQVELARRLKIFDQIGTEVMELYWNVEEAEKTGDQELINAERVRLIDRLAQIMHWK